MEISWLIFFPTGVRIFFVRHRTKAPIKLSTDLPVGLSLTIRYSEYDVFEHGMSHRSA